LANQARIAERKLQGGIPYNFCIAMTDLDKFKAVNDTYGHQSGDKVLKSTAEILLRTRPTDVVARYGGEEFGLILPEATLSKGLIGLRRVKSEIGKQTFEFTRIKAPHDKENVVVTASIGLIPYVSGMNVDEMITEADKYLYEAKHTGRNRICYKKSN